MANSALCKLLCHLLCQPLGAVEMHACHYQTSPRLTIHPVEAFDYYQFVWSDTQRWFGIDSTNSSSQYEKLRISTWARKTPIGVILHALLHRNPGMKSTIFLLTACKEVFLDSKFLQCQSSPKVCNGWWTPSSSPPPSPPRPCPPLSLSSPQCLTHILLQPHGDDMGGNFCQKLPQFL